MLTLRRKIWLGVIVLFFILDIFAWSDVFTFSNAHSLKVDILDVGQGDAIFIETPTLRHILIDGGPTSVVVGKLNHLLPLWDRTLDLVVLTHPDADHLNGLLSVLQRYHVNTILWTGIDREGQAYQEWLSLLSRQKRKGSRIVIASSGMKITNGDIALDILHPFENVEGQFFKQGNDSGIVSHLSYGINSFLFTADVTEKVETQMLDRSVNLSSDVLKIGHHGSKYSSSEPFLAAVSPRFAAISVGAKNSYGHPTPEVLQRLQNFGITTLRTDRDGDIIFLSDGKNIQVE